MWKGFLGWVLVTLFLWFGLQLFLDYNTNLRTYDKTSLNFIIVTSILMVLWGVCIIVIICSDLLDGKYNDTIFTEFYVADVCTVILLSSLGLVYYLLYNEEMQGKIADLFITLWITSGWVILLAIILALIYIRRRRFKQDLTKNGKIKVSRLDSGKKDSKKKEQIIRSLPTIIYQEYYKFKTKSWDIWDKEFASGESLKVYPDWYHIFHSDCIKQYYQKRECWPIDENSIDLEDLNKMKATFEADLIKRL